MAQTLSIPPSDLLIDEENPRISSPNVGQNRALQILAHLLDKKLVSLAADIVRYGLDPSNLSIVMPVLGTPQRYTVLEGNRRLAALRVLENPDSVAEAVSASTLKSLRKLSRQYQATPIDAVDCVVLDREMARHWIELRHTGLNQGAGVMPWGSDEAELFRNRSGLREPHAQALDFLQHRGDLSPETRRKIPVTTLKRLIETPDVRAKLGLELQKGHLAFLADEKPIAKALMHVINDLVSGRTKVGQVYTAPQRKKYARDLPPDIVVTPTAKPGQGTASTTASSAAKAKARKGAATTRKRDRLIPKDCVLSIPSGRIHDIESELRKLSLEEHTNAVSVLFRVFLELSVDSYIEDNALSGVTNDSKLRVKVEKVANDLEAKDKINKQQARAIRSANMDHSFLAPGVNTMNDYIHNEYIFPEPSGLRAHWNSLQPFITAIWTQ
jgi:hypothetical protein